MTLVEIVWGLAVAMFSAGLSWFVTRKTMRTQIASDAHVAAVSALLPALVPLRALLHESIVRQQEPAKSQRQSPTSRRCASNTR